MANNKNESRRDQLKSAYEKGGWRRTAPKNSPAGRNRDANKKK